MIDLVPNREDYYWQLNNEQDPKIACQSTTATQCIYVVDDVKLLKGPSISNGRTICDAFASMTRIVLSYAAVATA